MTAPSWAVAKKSSGRWEAKHLKFPERLIDPKTGRVIATIDDEVRS